nr:MAG: RNA-dependent RNA polymerase [Dracophyllum associated botourmia-like virus 34]
MVTNSINMKSPPSMRQWTSRNRPRETKEACRWWFSGGHRFKSEPAPRGVNPFWIDPGLEPANTADMRERQREGLGEVVESCSRNRRLRKTVAKAVKLLRVDQSLVPVKPMPTTIECGGIRKALRSMFSPELSLVQELSIKTSSKMEVRPCEYCENLQSLRAKEWDDRRCRPAVVDVEALDAFEHHFRENVPAGWDRFRTAYVPNGHACKGASRCQGGNWNEQPLDKEVDVQVVMSSGKPRTVTLYSSGNVQALTPLHNSLYTCLKRRGWLLVGSPTDERLRQLYENSLGTEWLSFDYEQATDNIKTAYVRRAVKVLKERAEFLSEDEIFALDVFSHLELGGRLAETGQPMGSPMSFPILCLINKSVVDMALTALHTSGKISFKEWTSHRCLINGDDLLMRSTSNGDLVAAVRDAGLPVGLITNSEKTMVSTTVAEINSTCFVDCVEQKKTNLGAIWMAGDVEDVLGFAHQAAATDRGFVDLVERNAGRLSKQSCKYPTPIPSSRRSEVVKRRKLQTALRDRPSHTVDPAPNLFPVVPVPDGYNLRPEEERKVLTDRVRHIRDIGSWTWVRPALSNVKNQRKKVKIVHSTKRKGGLWSTLRLPKTNADDRTLSCFVKHWEWKKKEALLAGEPWEESRLPPSDFTRIGFTLDLIKTQRNADRPHIQHTPVCVSFGDYVSLSDE